MPAGTDKSIITPTTDDIVDEKVGKRRSSMRRGDGGETEHLERGRLQLGDEVSSIQPALPYQATEDQLLRALWIALTRHIPYYAQQGLLPAPEKSPRSHLSRFPPAAPRRMSLAPWRS